MKRVLSLLLLFGFFVVAVWGQTKPRLAILPFTGGSGGDGETIAELFSFESEIGRVFVRVPRTSSIDAVMKEQQFQRSGLTDADTIARLGRQLNADYVVAGHIQSLGASKLVLITIIHVESLQQIAGDFKEYKNIEEMQVMISAMAKRIVASSRQSHANLPKLAVLPFAIPAQGVNQSDAEVLAQLLATEMANSGKYAVLPRTSTIQTVMREHQIQRSGLTDPESAKVIGKALNAQYVLAGSVRRLGQANMFTAQILEVESGSLITGDVENYNAIGDGISKMVALGGKLLAGASGAAGAPPNFVRVEGGNFQMGDENGRSDDKTIHTVTVKSFFMSKYEVTQKEWLEVMGNNPSIFKGDDLPVENISWYDAAEYCNRRSVKEGLTPAYSGSGDAMRCDWNADGYRLPTEAEWEYAAKGGNKDRMTFEYSGNNNAESVAWFASNSGNKTHPVGSKMPNSLGLYDMSGNVWEWCWDWYGAYSSSSQTDPSGAYSGNSRVLRGGSCNYSAAFARTSNRDKEVPFLRGYHIGFRIVCP